MFKARNEIRYKKAQKLYQMEQFCQILFTACWSNFEIAALFHHLYGEGKRAAILNLELFSTEWSRFYIVLSLERNSDILAFSANYS